MHFAEFVRKNTVMVIAFMAALVTSFIIPVDKAYLGYFDFKTLTCLFCVLAVVCALKNINFFYMLAKEIVKRFKTARMSILVLVYITFIGSMLIANDMALLTFLPLGYFVLSSTGKHKYMAFTFIMQNIAANLGGMLTPFGNPQNLYLYTQFEIPNAEFITIMAPPFVLAVAIITACCMFVKNEPLMIIPQEEKLNVARALVYSVLFALSIIMVFNIVHYTVITPIIVIALLFLDRKALAKVDYGLLLTFCAFFVFSGNMSRIDAVSRLFSYLLNINTMVFSALSCQFISNVPSAILLSQFTDNYRELLVGVNLGGAGTLIASLASLITFREYTRHNKGKTGYYVALFSAYNFGFLIVLTAIMMVKL